MSSIDMKIFRPWTSRTDRIAGIEEIVSSLPQSTVYPSPLEFNLADYYYRNHFQQQLIEEWPSLDWLFSQTTADNSYFALSGFAEFPFPTAIIGGSDLSKFPSTKRPKKFSCPHCKVSFSNNGQLKGHVRIHTGERPFKCDQEKCGKSFTRNEELTRHKRIHTGLRPYPCQHCGKPFGRKDHLKKHVRTHFPQPRYDPILSSAAAAQYLSLYHRNQPLMYASTTSAF